MDIYEEFKQFVSPSNIGLGCSDGWEPLIRRIFQYCEEVDYKIQVVQVKEKFGTLRFYYDMAEGQEWVTEHDNVIHSIMEESENMCVFCGAPTDGLKYNGWVRSTCDKCEETYQKGR